MISPPGPLSAVLQKFRKVADLKVSAANEELLTIQSPGVTGQFTAEQALRKILAGTGLEFAFNPDGSVILRLKRQSSSVEVTAAAPALSSSLPKYQQSPLDTPQTITIVPRQVLEQQRPTPVF